MGDVITSVSIYLTMKFAGNAVFGRVQLNELFGQKTKRPDKECFEMCNFVVDVMMQYIEIRNKYDITRWQEKFPQVGQAVWRRLLEQQKSADVVDGCKCWPVLKHRYDNPNAWWQGHSIRVAWFQKSERISDWSPIIYSDFPHEVLPFPFTITIPLETKDIHDELDEGRF